MRPAQQTVQLMLLVTAIHVFFVFGRGPGPVRSVADRHDEGPPNIVLFQADDLGWYDLGCMGNEFYETPNTDQLANEGIRFTTAYAAASVCSPTRAALQTGRYPARLRITNWIAGGYHGKGSEAEYPTGYNKHEDRGKLYTPKNYRWLSRDELTIAEMLKQKNYHTLHVGKWHLGPGNHDYWKPHHQGFDRHLHPGNKKKKKTMEKAKAVVEFLKNERNRPFFVQLDYDAVHGPFRFVDEQVAEKYRNKPNSDRYSANFAATLEIMDRATGNVLDALEKYKLEENTMVIFTSDNGGTKGAGPKLNGGKGAGHLEGGVRVPAIVRYPGVVPAGTTSNEPVHSIDWFPTILDAAGIELPDDRPIDGISILEHMKSGGEETLPERPLYWHFPHYRGRGWPQNHKPHSVIRKGRWKLVRWYTRRKGEYRFKLVDLRNDPKETNNLAKDRPELVEKLNNQLGNALEQMDARFPIPNPNYEN